jgi:hypothetical protein
MIKISKRLPQLAAAAMAVAAAGFVLWQNSRVAVLWDLGYLLDTGWRIAAGQMPYRDFPLAHAPMTFLTQALLIKIFGRCYLATELYAAVTGGLSVWLGWLALSRLIESRWLALALTAPLVFLSTQGVYPHPIYDTDAGLAVLFAVWLLVVLAQETEASWWRCVLTGAAVIVPVFYKQNIGLPFAFAVGVAAVVMLLNREEQRRAVGLLGGMFAASIAAVVAMASTVGLGNYYHWTVAFAAQRRMPGVALIVAIYQTQIVYWALPMMLVGFLLLHTRAPRLISVIFIVAPFVWTVWLVLSAEDADDMADALLALWPLVLVLAGISAVVKLCGGARLERLIPFVILAAIHGAFLSQQLWGSTYAIWPLMVLLVAATIATLPEPTRWWKPALAVSVATVLVICGAVYAVSLERLSYIDIPDGGAARSTVTALRGLRTPGEFLSNFDELVHWTDANIPRGDALLLMPGEDPFYYATGRAPQFPVTMMDPATDPFTAEELFAEAARRDVKWVIVKSKLQARENPMPQKAETMQLVARDYVLTQKLNGYEVWKRLN